MDALNMNMYLQLVQANYSMIGIYNISIAIEHQIKDFGLPKQSL